MKRILLLEPNTVIAELYQRIFRKEGYEVVLTVSAQEAITAADAQAPDIVVMELQLPKHSGIEFLHEFRSYPEWGHIPVIVNTVIAPGKLADLRQPLTRELGVAAVLYKPKTSLETLLQTVQTQLAAQ